MKVQYNHLGEPKTVLTLTDRTHMARAMVIARIIEQSHQDFHAAEPIREILCCVSEDGTLMPPSPSNSLGRTSAAF